MHREKKGRKYKVEIFNQQENSVFDFHEMDFKNHTKEIEPKRYLFMEKFIHGNISYFMDCKKRF